MAFWNKYPYTDFHELNLDWILKVIHGLEKKVSDFSADIKSYVDDWLDNHPEATTTVLDGSITEPKINSDFLKEILNEDVNLFGYNFRRVDRQFIINDGTNAYNQQGGTVIDGDTVVYALLDYDYLSNNIAHIIEHKISAHTYTEKAQLIIGHCDSMAYDRAGGKLYIAPAYQAYNGVEIQHGDIYIYDYSTMTLLDIMTGINANSVGFDNDNNKLYYTTFDNKWKDENGVELFEFDVTWTSSRQGIFIYKGYPYLVTAFPNNIRQFDFSGNIIRDIPLREFYDFYFTGELQWAGVYDTKLFAGTMIDCEDGTEKYPQLFETDLETNIYSSDHSGAHVMTTIHADSSSTAFNPNGTSNNQFKSINEAILYANCRKSITELDLYDGTYKGRINCNMAIIGNGNTILEPTFKSCCARITDCASVNNAVITVGCYVESPIEFTPDTGSYYLTKTYSETQVSGTGWTWDTSYNYIRGKTVFLKLAMKNTGTPSSSWVTIATGYPKPKVNWFFMSVDKGGHVYRLRVNTNGELAVANLGGSTLDIDNTFTYPTY